ncbi:MAG: DUF5711 family protein, partial [Clostridiales bacterium]|nr:DUF5711 family protein [Clostridiales bacterium]
KNNLRIVETNWDEIEQKIRAHRLKRLRRIAIIVGICVAAVVVYYLLMQHKTYDDYTVAEEISRSDTSAARYLAYADGYLKYSNDGISYVTVNNTVLWNQSYGMEDPMVSTCESFVAVADRQGNTVYVLNESGLQAEIAVDMPASQIEIASQGTVAVLMEESGAGYLALYDKSGELLAEGGIYMENSGMPMDIALSADGSNLAVSIVDVSSGTAATTIHFYNFGTSGKNQVDNLVGTFTYEDTIIPQVVFSGESRLLAFADVGVYTFDVSGTPTESNSLSVSDEIQSVFYDDSYFGLVYSDTSKDAGRIIKVYDTNCREQTSIETEFSYDSVGFLDNHEICLLNDTQCSIFTLGGLRKFSYEFEEEIRGFFHVRGFRNYAVLKENTTEMIRLRLFPDFTMKLSEE